MSKIKMLVIHTTFKVGGGAERFLLNFLNLFPDDKYTIDLLLFDNLQDDAKMFDSIPKNINVLPFLWQFSGYTSELIEYLLVNGQYEAVKARKTIYERNQNVEFKMLPSGERLIANWELLRTVCPKYKGYDYAIAFTHTLPVRILDCYVQARDKCVFIHNDFKLICSESESQRSSILSEYQHYTNMDRIVCVTLKNLLSFQDLFPDLEGKLSVLLNVSNSVAIKESSTAYFPGEYRSSCFNILTIARVHPQKNIELLLNTAKTLQDKNILFKWFILGHLENDEYTMKCMKLYQSLNLKDTVEFLEEVPNPYPYYKHCSLFVVTSRYEGRSLAIEEAMILNCPIVSTNFTSIYDQINDGVSGRICEMLPGKLASVIEELYHDSEQRNRLATANSGYTGDYEKSKYLEFFS